MATHKGQTYVIESKSTQVKPTGWQIDKTRQGIEPGRYHASKNRRNDKTSSHDKISNQSVGLKKMSTRITDRDTVKSKYVALGNKGRPKIRGHTVMPPSTDNAGG